jgi:hypothetical protein
MDIRKKQTLTYEEAIAHLSRAFNQEAFKKIHDAIRKEIESEKSTH